MPDFIPALGTLYVDPKTLPVGPFLGYDHAGRQVNTIYMVPLREMNDRKKFAGLLSPGGDVDHVDITYNNGHPSVPWPHYHIVLWHITRAEQAALAQSAPKVDPFLLEQKVQKAPPPSPYVKASASMQFPQFIPGFRSLDVDPSTARPGPYLACGRSGTLIAASTWSPWRPYRI